MIKKADQFYKCCRVDFKYSKAKKSSQQCKDNAADTCRKDKHAYLAEQWHLFLCRTESLLGTSLPETVVQIILFKLFQEQLPFL